MRSDFNLEGWYHDAATVEEDRYGEVGAYGRDLYGEPVHIIS